MSVLRIFVVAFALVILVLLVGSAVLLAQTNVVVGEEMQLSPLTSVGFDKLAGEPCGPYFRFTGVPKEPGKVGIVTLVAISVTKDGAKNVTILPWGSDKFQIRIGDGFKVPKLKVLRAGGPVYPWAEIVISPEDLKRAPCLTHSKIVA